MANINELFTKDLANTVSKDAAKLVANYITGKGKNSIIQDLSKTTSSDLKTFRAIGKESQNRLIAIKNTKKELANNINNPLLLNRQLALYQAALTKAYVFIQETGNFITQTNFTYSFLFEGVNGATGKREAKIANLNITDIIPALELSFNSNGVRLNLTNLNSLKAIERNITHQTETQKLIGELYLNLLYASGGQGSRRTQITNTFGEKQKLTGRGKKGLAFEAATGQVIDETTKALSSAVLNLDLARQTVSRMKNNPAPFYTGKDTTKGLRSLGGQKTRMELKKFELDREWYGAGLTGEQTIVTALLKINELIRGTNIDVIQKNLKIQLFENTSPKLKIEEESEKILREILQIKLT